PAGYERGPVATQPSYLVLSGRRRDDDAARLGLAIQLDPIRERPAGHRIRTSARHASLLQRKAEPIDGQGDHDLLGLAESVAKKDRRHAAVERQPAPASDRLDRGVRVAEAEVRPSVCAFQNEDVRLRDVRGWQAARLAQLDVAGVQDSRALVLEQ